MVEHLQEQLEIAFVDVFLDTEEIFVSINFHAQLVLTPIYAKTVVPQQV